MMRADMPPLSTDLYENELSLGFRLKLAPPEGGTPNRP
jgi:hypothetical protein